jgi:hypothetical protein
MTTKRQRQQQQQIPFGDDKQKGNSNGNSRSLRDDNKRGKDHSDSGEAGLAAF